MKKVVSLELHPALRANSTVVSLLLNEQVLGEFSVRDDASPVVDALLLLGFQSVTLAHESGAAACYTKLQFAGEVLTICSPEADNLGDVTLTERWSEPLEAYRLDVSVNGKRIDSVDAKMTFGTLRALLVRLGFTIGYVEAIALAA